jgi:murein DD-endopeptidase MepM/ murein hydrolase activator NlpD
MRYKEKMKNFLHSLRKLNGISILFLPEYGGSGTRTYKFGLYQVVSIFIFYSLVLAVLGFLLLGVTPLRDIVFPGSGLSKSERAEINELNNRLNRITGELESLKGINERLKYAIGLGDSTLLKTLEKAKDNKDTVDNKRKKNPFGGNIFAAFNLLFQDKKEKSSKTYYFSKPTDSFISRGFEPERGHLGIDFVVKSGTPVYAAANGYVIFADYTTKDGYMIILDNDNGYITVYKHCSVLLKRSRDVVLQGETIALSGNTGEISTAPHLHF